MNKNLIRQLINSEHPVIFEIGAADGIDTEEFIQNFNDLDFYMYCFEPAIRNTIEFEKRIQDKRVQLLKCAIGNVDGEVSFYEGSKNKITGQEFLYSDSLRKPGKDLFEIWPMFGDKSTFKRIKVKSVKLDTFVKENNIGIIDFVWMDVQGAEDLVIKGAKESLENNIRFLYTEYSNREIYKNEPGLDKILSMLPNFQMIADFGTDVLLKNKRF
jgi:2-O-methyltransferase